MQSSNSSQLMMREYQQDYREMLRVKELYRSNGNGGASSSKKLKMEQARSKGVAVREIRQEVVSEEVGEDVVESPEVSDEENRKRSRSKRRQVEAANNKSQLQITKV